jgi:serine/threonine protein phosphatase PrpC
MAEEQKNGGAIELCYAAKSVRGKRDRLQDNYFCTREIIRRGAAVTSWAEVGGLDTDGTASAPLPELLDFVIASELAPVRLFALADGVGGHNRGDLAAAEAVRLLPLFYQPEQLRQELEAAILRHGLAAKSPLEGVERLTLAETIGALLRATYQLINVRLHFHEVPDIRTTLVTLALEGPRLHLANVGDSRVYRLGRDSGGLLRAPERLTVDDSYLDRKIYEGEFLPFAPCSYEVAAELREHLEAEDRYSQEFIFDLTRLEGRPGGEAFEELCKLAHEEISRILADGSARLYRRAMQLGTIAPAQQIKDEGLLRALGHQEWLADGEIGSGVRQGQRRRSSLAEPRWVELGDGELLLLCSDGLTDALPESRIHQILGQRLGEQPASGSEALAVACAELVALAEREESCSDNVSAVLVQTPVPADFVRRSDTGRLSRAAVQRRVESTRSAAPMERGPEPGPIEASPVSAVPSAGPPQAETPLTRPPAAEDRSAPDRSAARLVQALVEKKTADREILGLLKLLDTRLAANDDKLEELLLAVGELRARLNGLARRGEALESMSSLPTIGIISLILLGVLVLLQILR